MVRRIAGLANRQSRAMFRPRRRLARLCRSAITGTLEHFEIVASPPDALTGSP